MTKVVDTCRTSSQEGGTHVALIEAASGYGKTRLLDSLEKYCRSLGSVFCCRGSFDSQEPMAGLLQVLQTLGETLMADDDGKDSSQDSLDYVWKIPVKQALGTDEHFMQNRVPALRELLNNDRRRSSFAMINRLSETESSEFTDDDDSGYITADLDWGLDRFRVAFRSLIRQLSTHVPIVLILDNLDQAERDSLEVVRSLLLDKSRKDRQALPGRLVVFATYQPLPAKHLVFKLVDLIYKEQHKFSQSNDKSLDMPIRSVDAICLEKLQADQVGRIVGDLLEQVGQEMELLPLVNLLNQVSQGHPQTLTLILRYIYKVLGFIKQDQEKLIWDQAVLDQTILQSPLATDAVVRLLIDSLEDNHRLILSVIALLGNPIFDADTLSSALVPDDDEEFDLENHGSSNSSSNMADALCCHSILSLSRIQRIQKIKSWLADIQDLGLIHVVDDIYANPDEREQVEYFEIHYKARKGAHHHLLPEEMDRIHLVIGRRFNSIMHVNKEMGTYLAESFMFNTVNQMTMASHLVTDRWELLDLVDLNYQAAEVATLKCSYYFALQNLTRSIDIALRLNDNRMDPWKNDYALMKKLYNAQSRTYMYCGKFEDSVEVADQIIQKVNAFEDKKLAYRTKILSLQKQEGVQVASHLILKILNDELGHGLPKTDLKGQIHKCATKISRLLQGKTDDDILISRQFGNDDENCRLRDAAEFYLLYCDIEYNGKISHDFVTLFLMKLLLINLESGRTPALSMSLVAFGSLRLQEGHQEEALRFGALALRCAAQGHGGRHDARAKIMFYTLLHHWQTPSKAMLLPISQALSDFHNLGAFEMAAFDSVSSLQMSFLASTPLDDLVFKASKVAEDSNNYKRFLHEAQPRAAPLLQMLFNFHGGSKKPIKLDGAHFDSDQKVTRWTECGNKEALQLYYLCATTLGLFFADLKQADSMCNSLSDEILLSSHFMAPYVVFLKGCIGYLMARIEKSRKHRKQGDAALKQFNHWVLEDGRSNIMHYGMILNALRASCTVATASTKSIRAAFDEAILQCQKAELEQFSAFVHEMAGILFAEQRDTRQASIYLERSKALYKEWGAHAKVSHMRKKYSSYLNR